MTTEEVMDAIETMVAARFDAIYIGQPRGHVVRLDGDFSADELEALVKLLREA